MYNNIIQSPNFYRVGLYIRLSESDEGKSYESESESIINQRNLLMDYVRSNGFTLIDEYVDDGFTGTNFDRPGFKRLIEDIECGRINCVITKDLSRLGRDYIQCGYYVEQYFPQNKIRYISILDRVDTFEESANNDIAPFKALFNDMTSKDTSKKIRSILKNKKEQGKFIGSKPSYGYMRDPLDKGHLIPDPNTSAYVKKIFEMAYEGIGISDIVSYLNDNNILSPSMYKNTKPSSKQKTNVWTVSSVNKILKNRMYTGDMVQNVQTKLSYKSQKKVSLEKSFWIIVENTHEPLVSKKVFESIQNAPTRTRVTFKNRVKRLFENLLICKECGNALSLTYRKNHKYWTINCNKYSRDPRRGLCTPHFFPYDKLEKDLLEIIRNTCSKYLEELNVKELSKKISNVEIKKNKSREEENNLISQINDLKRKLDALYEDKYNEVISVDTYMRISKSTENQIFLLEKQLDEIKSNEKNIKEDKKKFLDYESEIKKLLDLENPNRELIKTLVDKIIIDQNKNVEIVYKFKILDNVVANLGKKEN